MFVTSEEVYRVTGYDVTNEVIIMAQTIVETYIGRIEAQVFDGFDKQLLERATAYQAAYMKEDPTKVFEQISASQVSQFGATITFKAGDETSPWVAPLAKLACQRLSWKRMRSVKVGNIYGARKPEPTWVTD